MGECQFSERAEIEARVDSVRLVRKCLKWWIGLQKGARRGKICKAHTEPCMEQGCGSGGHTMLALPRRQQRAWWREVYVNCAFIVGTVRVLAWLDLAFR